MSELPAADPSSARPRSLGQKTAALLIDLTLLGAIVYAGRVIVLSVVLYLDDLTRHLLLGLSWSASLDELRGHLHSHPLLLGRPVLMDVLADNFGPAALLALYLAFLNEFLGGDSPGTMLFSRDGAWKQIRAGSKSVFDELAAKIRNSIRSWIPGQTAMDLRQRIGKLGELFAPARSLPEGSRAVGMTALGIAAVLVAATPGRHFIRPLAGKVRVLKTLTASRPLCRGYQSTCRWRRWPWDGPRLYPGWRQPTFS